MGLFNFFKKSNENSQKINFSERDIKIGTKVLLLNVSNRIDYQMARKIFIETAIAAKTVASFDINALKKIMLGKYSSFHFLEREIDAYYQFLLVFVKTKSPINISNFSNDFYDKMFEEILNSNLFAMPQYACFVTEKRVIYANSEENQMGIVSGYVYLWLRNIMSKNKLFYKHILSLIPNDFASSYEEQKSLIGATFSSVKLEQLYEDKNTVYQIYNRIKAYLKLIDRLTNGLLAFYSEQENDINYFLSRANQNYLPTNKIRNIAQLNIQDIDRIFIRDMLNGKNLS
ncbi:MAG: hypothetical protein LBU44_01700 [Mediterranea sp.]|jgi:hypothetical protein|nr:hypothetical protein [Mediterranea sp.]